MWWWRCCHNTVFLLKSKWKKKKKLKWKCHIVVLNSPISSLVLLLYSMHWQEVRVGSQRLSLCGVSPSDQSSEEGTMGDCCGKGRTGGQSFRERYHPLTNLPALWDLGDLVKLRHSALTPSLSCYSDPASLCSAVFLLDIVRVQDYMTMTALPWGLKSTAGQG